MSKQLSVYPIDGVNLSFPSHRIGDMQCSVLQNAICRDRKVFSFPGSHRYNATALPAKISWTERFYGILAAGSFTKKTFCYSSGKLFVGNETDGSLTEVHSGLPQDVLPESTVLQEAGNSIMFLFTTDGLPIYYDGNEKNTWYSSSITKSVVQGEEWLDRLWVFGKNSSVLSYSKTLFPQNFTDSTDSADIIIGNDRDSFIRRIIKLGDTLYIFKNNSIYYIEGRTPSTFAVRIVTNKYGLAAQRAINYSGNAIVFLNEFDKEWYSFGGTETSIKKLSGGINFSDLINYTKISNICCIEHKNLFRISYQPFEQNPEDMYNSREACYPTDELNKDKEPKWCFSKGANIMCYSVWNRQGDNNDLVTGRSDEGRLMYHYRGNNWDNTAMEVIIRTKDKVYYDGYNTIFNFFVLDGLPKLDKSVTLRTYLNSRITGASIGSDTLSLDGEEKSLAGMSFTTQTRFNNKIVPLVSFNKGNSLSFEIYSNTKDVGFELYGIIVDYEIADAIMTNLVGG